MKILSGNKILKNDYLSVRKTGSFSFIFQNFYQENMCVCVCVYLKLEKVISLKRDPNDLKN